ncbi:amino acid adenylation domain-containing protein [Rhodohalobacter sp. 8-1]|uniref:amino acid adenylation domain-containing protein n=1 Tax=Rhodohalobacter sp. 8-1 TaxID=3131972 RepID=UPI0030EBFDC8
MDKSKLLAKWLQQKTVESESLTKKPEGSPNLLSYGQRRLFFLQQTYPSNPFYNYSELYTLRGNWDMEKFKKCVVEVCLLHDIFFHNFKLNRDHEPEIVINQERDPVIIEHVNLPDLSNDKNLDEYFFSKGRYLFDLAEDVLFRVTIVTISDSEHQVLFTLHHIITDIWSMRIFRNQLLELYEKQTGLIDKNLIREINYDYLDYSYHQKNTPIPEQEINYWKEKLSEPLDEMALPVDQKPSEITHNGNLKTYPLPLELSKKIKQLAREQETTLFTLFLSAYNILLHRYSGEKTIQIGTPISNRNQKEWESIFGFFIETVLLQTHIESNSLYKEYLQEVKEDVLEAFDHKKVPYETIVSHLSTHREAHKNPLFRSMFLFHHKEDEKQPLPGLQMEYQTLNIGVAKFDLTIFVEEDNENLSITYEYATDYFEDETIDRMHEHYHALLQDIVTDPNQKINDLNILNEEEISQFKNWNATDFEAEPIPIDKAFEEIALNNPNSIAVTDSNSKLTFKELNERANALANTIQKLSEPKKRIGLYFGRQSDMIIAMLGTLKSGCSYVPLDPSYPNERIHYIIEDANIDLVITSSNFTDDLDIDIEKIEIEKIGSSPDQPLKKTKTVYDEAYVIYTSGSTGKPKGVSISHKNLFYSTYGRPLFYENSNPTCFLLFSSFSFDSSIAGIYWTLLTGGNLLISEERAEQDIQQVAKLIQQEKVSHILLLPSLYQVLLSETHQLLLESLEIVMVAGEVCSASTVEQHFNNLPNTKLYNEYGPTEATVWCLAHCVSQQDSVDRVPIGRPIPGSKAYILDTNNHRVPVGVIGELFIGGEGVSNGYIGNATADNNLFIENPFDNGKIYKTGDLASYRKDGNIDFRGRIDDQIKIRGHRVELKEIERALTSIKQIYRAVVIFDDSKQQLFAFFIQDQTSQIDKKDARKRLNKLLPKYMVPSSILPIEDFPHLPNGKIDQKRLIEMISRPDPVNKEPTHKKLTPIEEELIDIWKEILNQSSIGINDNFFALGGDSISSIRMVSKAKAKGIHLSPTQIFETQTIKDISSFLKEKENQVRLPETTSVAPQSPIQRWFFEFYTDHPNHWHQILEFETQILKTEVEWKQLFNSILQRHQALRSCFKDDVQIFADKKSESITDNSFHFFQEGDIRELTKPVIRQTEISAENLFQVLILSEKQTTTVRLIAHHLIIDIFSYNQILQELSTALSNEVVPQQNYQCSQFSNYLEQLSHEDFFNDELSFWESQYCEQNFWDSFYQSDIREKDLQRQNLVLTKEKTGELIQFSQNSEYKLEEVVLSSLLFAINQKLNISEILVGLEHNGRELPNNISFSDSVGWFTSFYPRKFTIQEGETKVSQLIQTLRETPNFGIGFGVLKYLKKVESLQSFNRFPITYNYVGKLETQNFNLIDSYQFIFDVAKNSNSRVYSPFDFSAGIVGGQLQINFRHPQELYSSDDAKELMNNVKHQLFTTLEDLEVHNTDGENKSDNVSDSDLDELSKLFEL